MMKIIGDTLFKMSGRCVARRLLLDGHRSHTYPRFARRRREAGVADVATHTLAQILGNILSRPRV